jgi:hypothetical protein
LKALTPAADLHLFTAHAEVGLGVGG